MRGPLAVAVLASLLAGCSGPPASEQAVAGPQSNQAPSPESANTTWARLRIDPDRMKIDAEDDPNATAASN